MDTSPDDPGAARRDGGGRRRFGPAELGAAVVAALFLGAALTYAVLARADRPSDAEIAFLQDMIVHHENAVEASLLVSRTELPTSVAAFAQEVVVFQQYEIGLMEATLRRWGQPRSPGETSMEWMGMAHPPAEMPGMASDEELAALRDAEGDEAAALWIAVMSRHHQAGVEMAEAGREVATDELVAELAERMATYQAQEILEYSGVRQRLGLPVPEGYTDPPTLDDDHAGHDG
jgi:uncharacterized protein (DUF305 family)